MAGVVGAVLVACGRDGDTDADCIPPPCPVPVAIHLTVTSIAGGPVSGLTVDFVGSRSGSAQCNVEATLTRCSVLGGHGTYQLHVAAPGFRPADLSVVVPGRDAAPCGCPIMQPQALDVILTPS
jgi:hypothetical protein